MTNLTYGYAASPSNTCGFFTTTPAFIKDDIIYCVGFMTKWEMEGEGVFFEAIARKSCKGMCFCPVAEKQANDYCKEMNNG